MKTDENEQVCKPVFIFLHIPKTGGITLSEIVIRNFASDRIFHVRNPKVQQAPRYSSRCGNLDQFAALPAAERASFDCLVEPQFASLDDAQRLEAAQPSIARLSANSPSGTTRRFFISEPVGANSSPIRSAPPSPTSFFRFCTRIHGETTGASSTFMAGIFGEIASLAARTYSAGQSSHPRSNSVTRPNRDAKGP
jgi:hypothetical protein